MIEERFSIPPACQERFLPLHLPAASPLQERSVSMAGLSTVTPGYAMGRPTPVFHMVCYGLAGAGQLWTPEGAQTIEAETLMVAPVGHPYGFEPATETWRFLWFHLDDTPQWAFLRGGGVTVRPSFATAQVAAAMEALLQETVRLEDDSPHAVRLLSELVGVYLDRELRAETQAPEHRHRHQLYRLWDRVNADLAHPWTVEEMASAVHLSLTHFHRVVVAATGKTPMQRVTQLRMERARELVTQHAYPLQWVAERVGYENAFSFSTAFKRHWGRSPRSYRKPPPSKTT